jgi:hypothetical protein
LRRKYGDRRWAADIIAIGTKGVAFEGISRGSIVRDAKLFHLMRDMYLDKLAMAGGEGRELLRLIKYEALREYRAKNGWHDRRL